MLGVRRHRPTARAGTNKPAPQPIARQRQLDELDVLRELLADTEPDEIESGDTLHYRVPGVQDAVMRRLRRGHYRIDGELDLHGHNRDRSEEHTSELQSLMRISYAVFCLKKKTTPTK